MPRALRLTCLVFALVALAAHVLQLGQPVFQDERPMIGAHIHFVHEGTAIPNFAKYPSAAIYLTFPGSLVWLAARAWWTGADLAAMVADMLVTQPVALYLGGRAVVLLTLLAAALLAWRGFRSSLGEAPAAVVALALLATPGLLEYSAYLLPDVPLMMWCMACLVCAMRGVAGGGGERWLYAAAACAGLAISTKYNGVSMVAVVAAAGVMLAGPDWRRLVRLASVSAAVCAAAFLAGSPGWLLATGFFAEDLAFELRHAAEGHMGAHGVPLLGQAELLLTNLPVLSLAGLAGMALWARRRRGDRAGWLALVTVLAGLAMAAATKKQSLQYLFILLPGLAWFAGVTVAALVGRAWGRAAIGLALAGMLAASLWQASMILRPGSTDLAARWLEQNVTPADRVALSWAYVPRLLTAEDLADLMQTPEYVATARSLWQVQPTQDVIRYGYDRGLAGLEGVDYVVTSDAVFARYFEHGLFTRLPPPEGAPLRAAFEARRDFYAALFASPDWQLAFEADTGHGPRTLIYRRVRK